MLNPIIYIVAKERSLIFDILSIIPLPIVHELGHILMARFYNITMFEIYLVPQQINDRYGVGVTIDYAAAPGLMARI
jgi:hypothetical protein